MSLTLSDVRLRAALLLGDETQQLFSGTLLDEAIRQALNEYSRSAGAPGTLAGLDGAAATSLPEEEAALLVRGAAGYAALSRAVQRMLSFNLRQEAGSDLLAWARRSLADFQAGLRQVRANRLHTAAEPPYPPFSASGSPALTWDGAWSESEESWTG